MRRASLTLALTILLSLLPLAAPYALEGTWVLTNQADLKLSPSLSIEFEFSKEIQNITIIGELIIHSCYDLSYSYSVKGNDISISYNKILDIPRKCGDGEITTIRSKIDTIFYFTIKGDSLSLHNPTGFAPFVFQRKVKNPPKAINGRWSTDTVLGQAKDYDIYMNGTHASLCRGNGLANYKISSLNGIAFTVLVSRGCNEDEVSMLNALDNALFFRIRNNQILYLYDYKVSNVLSATFAAPVGLANVLPGANEQTLTVSPKQPIPAQNNSTPQGNHSEASSNSSGPGVKYPAPASNSSSNTSKPLPPAPTPTPAPTPSKNSSNSSTPLPPPPSNLTVTVT
jgi:hypothetical protein